MRPRLRWLWFGILLVALCLLGSGLILTIRSLTWTDGVFVVPSSGGEDFSILSANVGNADPRCLPYMLKLCRRGVEARLAKNIQALRPDVVAIQEVLPDWMCEDAALTLPGDVCADAGGIPQIRRLLGPEYSIVYGHPLSGWRQGVFCHLLRMACGRPPDRPCKHS